MAGMTDTSPSRMTRDQLRQAWEAEQQRARQLEQQLAAATATESVAVNTKLTRASRDRLRALAHDRDTTLRQIIQTAVDQFLDDQGNTQA